MAQVNRHIYPTKIVFSEGRADKRTLFKNHPNLFLREFNLQILVDLHGFDSGKISTLLLYPGIFGNQMSYNTNHNTKEY